MSELWNFAFTINKSMNNDHHNKPFQNVLFQNESMGENAKETSLLQSITWALKSTTSKLIICGHKLALAIFIKHIWKNRGLFESIFFFFFFI